MRRRTKTTADVLGWREWVALPDLGVARIKAKIDTGARTSALHAESIQTYTRSGKKFVKFTIHPEQRSQQPVIYAHAPLLEKRTVRSSIGTETIRPVILTPVQIGQDVYAMEITLVNRDVMGFRMLIGRQGIKANFLVDPGRSFLTRKEKARKRK